MRARNDFILANPNAFQWLIRSNFDTIWVLCVQWTFEPFINWIRSFQYVERRTFAKINTFQCHLVTFRVFSLHFSLFMDPFRWDAHHFQLNVHHLSFSSFLLSRLKFTCAEKLKLIIYFLPLVLLPNRCKRNIFLFPFSSAG